MGDPKVCLQRGMPNYLRIHFSRWDMRPLESRVENSEFMSTGKF